MYYLSLSLDDVIVDMEIYMASSSLQVATIHP